MRSRRRSSSTGSAPQAQQRPQKQQQQHQQQQNQRLIHGPRCSLLMLLIVGQAVYASAGSELIANRSTSTEDSLTISPADRPSNLTSATPPAQGFSSPFREEDVAEGETEGYWEEERHTMTISRPPRAGRSERQAEEDQVDRCRLFVEGNPTKNELYSPNYPNLYPKNINCTRVITAPKGQIIRLDFRNSFNIEAKEDCKFDFLEIRDGQYGFSKELGKYCGTDFPPELTSKERYLWLHFHSDETIEYTGFSAVYEFLDRSREAPSTDLNCTIEKTGFEGFINSSEVPPEIWDQVTRNKIPLDCIWRIQVQEKWKIFLKFLDFKLSKPNDCDTNFLDIFPEQTVMPLRVKNFCGSAGESITADSNILHLRYYADQIAINSTFSILFTAFREQSTNGECNEEEYDCADSTCIASNLRCNGQDNCKFRWDEENCTGEAADTSEHVKIIIVVFGLILGGMVITFIVNCIRKIIRDQKIIREHVRESKESKLDEMGRNSKGRSRENISRQKHSQTSLQILDDVSNRYYREAIPLSTQSSKADLKEKEHSILRRHADMTQTSLCGVGEDDGESSSTTTANHEMMTKAAMSAVPSNACDMGCQTR
ncbi:neuropilin and tolloid-like protein 1 isoform X2 [Drosophila ficusphila]|nr:neuropilin and tolloid-like protein 1 isoform X2 [Drosophila ficusphila]